jgi:hypothetical protein
MCPREVKNIWVTSWDKVKNRSYILLYNVSQTKGKKTNKKCVSAMSIFVRQCSVEDVWMDGRGFPLTTTPSACFHPRPFRKISLPSGARPAGCSLSRPPSSPGCSRPRAGARLGCHARPGCLWPREVPTPGWRSAFTVAPASFMRYCRPPRQRRAPQ